MIAKVLLVLGAVALVHSKTVLIGETAENLNTGVRVIYERHIEAAAIPLIKRVVEDFFEYPYSDTKIKGIALRDIDGGLAEPSITSGGIKSHFVNIKLKSERGAGLNYRIQIYA